MKKVLYTNKGDKLYWDKGDLHTQYGMVKEKDIKQGKIKTHIGTNLKVLDAEFLDKLEKVKRGPAFMVPKDIGLILTNTNINKNSKVLDAGTGSGILSAYLSRFVKRVYSYERNPEFFKLAEENFKRLGIKNIELKQGDVYEDIKEDNLDLITLDLLEPWKALKNARRALRSGGYIAVYTPNVSQVSRFVKELDEHAFIFVKTIEVIEREWFVEDLRVRPKNRMLGHTGFLTFVRKI